MTEIKRMRVCKKRPSTTLNPNDLISNLPDDIISCILSRLKTKAAMKTSVLSRSWRHKWTSIYDFDIVESAPKHDMVNFTNFMTRILALTFRIRSFSLCLWFEEDTYISGNLGRYLENWISCALMWNVESLKICASQSPDSWCFRGWTLLTELELSMNCSLVLPVHTIFPNLKRLVLIDGDIRIKPEQISSEGRIVLIFPLLEYICLECEWLNVNSVEIHAPELITFVTHCPDAYKNYEIKIFGAKLTTFTSQFGSINNFDLQGSPAVSFLDLDHFLGESDGQETYLVSRAHKILKQSPNLKRLTLSGNLMLLLPSYSGLKFPTFNQLKELNLGYSVCIKDVVELLQLLPQVELLGVDLRGWNDNQTTWQPGSPKSVSNLKVVKLKTFCGNMLQSDFLNFILENAKDLKEMSITVDRDAPAPAQVKAMLKLLGRCAIKIL